MTILSQHCCIERGYFLSSLTWLLTLICLESSRYLTCLIPPVVGSISRLEIRYKRPTCTPVSHWFTSKSHDYFNGYRPSSRDAKAGKFLPIQFVFNAFSTNGFVPPARGDQDNYGVASHVIFDDFVYTCY